MEKKLIIWLSIISGLFVTGLILFDINKNSSLKDFSDQVGDGGFLSGEPCGPPCFLGIIPNVTKETEAVRILKEKGLYKNCTFVNNESESGLRGFDCSNYHVGITFFRGTDVVGIAGFDPPLRLTLDQVFAKHGEPNAVIVSSIWFTWEKQPETSMSLFYKDINTTISLGTQNGNVFNLTPATPIISISYVALGFPTPAEYEAENKYLSSWHGYGEYHDLANP